MDHGVGKVPTKGQQGQGFPQRHHEGRRPRGERVRLRVEEYQGGGFEPGVEF
jgi:hypothetical protein